ncbi:hypothetical protein T265_15683, partial [Opisthorchis viverrini]
MVTILDLGDISCHRRHIDQVEFNTKGENFTILQPGDEAKLLGDDVDEESIPFNLTGAAALDSLDKLDNDDHLINIRTTSDPKPSQPSGQPTAVGSKRTVSKLSESSACPVPEKSKAVESTQSNSDVSTAKTVISLAPSDQSATMSETDCLNARAIRFGLQRPAGAGAALTDDKLAARARRFGLPVNENRSTSTTAGGIRAATGPSIDAELLRKRAERFGEVTSPIVDKDLSLQSIALNMQVFDQIRATVRRISYKALFKYQVHITMLPETRYNGADDGIRKDLGPMQ